MFYNYPNLSNNSKQQDLGIGPHDYVVYTYNGNNDIASATYYVGGVQDQGTLVGQVIYAYNGSNQLIKQHRSA